MLEDANLLNNDGEGGRDRTVETSIILDGVNYATNLFWQPIQNASDFMPEVEEASTDIIEGADLFAVKGGKSPQFGICIANDGYKVGSNVAAIALTSSLSNFSSIVGVFKVGNGWWYVCSRNDVILSDGDMLYLDEEEAKSQLMSMLTVPDWDKKYAPPEWDLEDTEEGDIAELLTSGKKVKLQKIKALRGTKLIMVIVAAVICGWWLLSTLFDFMFTPTQKKVVRSVKPKTVQTATVASFPIPWNNIKSPTEFMNNCYKGIMDMNSLLPPGWESSGKILCSGETVATSWKNSIGLISWAEDAMRRSSFKNLNYSFSDTGNILSASMSLPKLPKIAQKPTKNMKDLRFELNKIFQELGITVNFSKKIIKLRAEQQAQAKTFGKSGPKIVTKDIETLGFKVKSEYTPLLWVKFLTKFSSFEIKNIEYEIKDKSWIYEGVFYVL